MTEQEKQDFFKNLNKLFDSLSKETELEVKALFEALPQEHQEFLRNKDNDYAIQREIQKWKDLTAYARGIPLTTPFTDVLVDGELYNFFTRYMSKHEGSGCSADKARFICKMISKSLIDNIEYPLFDNYVGHDRIPVERQHEQAYWSPRTIQNTEEAKRIYLDWKKI